MEKQNRTTPTAWQKAKVILIGGTLHLLKFIGHGIIFLRSGRKPVLVFKLPRTATQQEYITAVVSVTRDVKINRDYHVFVLKGTTNADYTHDVYHGRYKKAEIEELKKIILAGILETKRMEDMKKQDFTNIKRGKIIPLGNARN